MLYSCPHCGQQLQSDDALAGQVVACFYCHKQLQLPAAVVAAPVVSHRPLPRRKSDVNPATVFLSVVGLGMILACGGCVLLCSGAASNGPAVAKQQPQGQSVKANPAGRDTPYRIAKTEDMPYGKLLQVIVPNDANLEQVQKWDSEIRRNHGGRTLMINYYLGRVDWKEMLATSGPEKGTAVDVYDMRLTEAQKNEPRIGPSYENFQRIRTGMSESEVIAILGRNYEVLAENEFGSGTEFEVETRMLSWKQGLGIGNCNVMFQNGEVVSKAQFGLK